MLRLRIKELLQQQGHTKYWLRKQFGGISYQNLSRIINNETSQIRFDTLERLSDILNVPIGDLFEKIDDSSESAE